MQDELAEWIYYFGYAKVGQSNPTGFFDFKTFNSSHVADFNRFKADSQAAHDQITSASYRAVEYTNKGAECFDMLSADDLPNCQAPAVSHARSMLQQAEQKKKAATAGH